MNPPKNDNDNPVKRYRVSTVARIVCSECTKGFNGDQTCPEGGRLRTRHRVGCPTGTMLESVARLPFRIKAHNDVATPLKHVKSAVVSRDGFIVCSECENGFNGDKTCPEGGCLITRQKLGCHSGTLLPELVQLSRNMVARNRFQQTMKRWKEENSTKEGEQ